MTPLLLAAIVLAVIGAVIVIEDTIDAKNSRVYREYSVVGPVIMILAAVLAAIEFWSWV